MGSGYIGIPFYGLLVECDEDVALDIDAKRVNVINIRDAQKKSFWRFFFGKLVLGVGGYPRFGDVHIVAIALGQAHGSGNSWLRFFAVICDRQDQKHAP